MHRCWAGYQPSAGDASALSCTRADTCFNPVLAKQTVCDACPLQEAEDFLSFACSSLTKKCTCGVQRYERTRCTSHSQCFSAQADAVCMRIDDVFSTSFSTTPCSSCMTQQVCVVTSADSAGYCACPFVDVEVEPCTDIGLLVTPDPVKLCNVMLNSQILSTSNTYVSWSSLAITSCAILDPASTYCLRVDATGGVQRSHATASVVGSKLLSTGRRRRRNLLGMSDGDNNDTVVVLADADTILVEHMLWNASWSGNGGGNDLCMALVHAYRARNGTTGMTSVVDRHMLKECLHIRFITNRTIQAYNWTSVAPSDTFMLSWHGFAKVSVNVCVFILR